MTPSRAASLEVPRSRPSWRSSSGPGCQDDAERPVQLSTAPPPASALSLWYRQPAADRPLTTPRPRVPPRPRVGARPAGRQRPPWGDGVRRRGQRTAAAERRHAVGRRPVRPGQSRRQGRAAGGPAPARRWALRRRRQLASQKVMAKPLAQMPYQTLGDLTLTFPDADVVERLPARSRPRHGDRARAVLQRTASPSRAKCSPARPTR